MPLRLIPAATSGDLISSQTKQEEVLPTCLFSHLDRRPVSRANGERAVHHELHVARSAGFISGGRNLVRYIARRNQPLGNRYAIIRNEDNLYPTARRGIGLDRA